MARYKTPAGYVVVKRPDIAGTKDGYMPESRAVWTDKHGPIPPGAVVHHINGIKDDNRIENLELFTGNGEHLSLCHTDLSYLDNSKVKPIEPFTDEDMQFIRAHLPIDRVLAKENRTTTERAH